MRNEISRKKYRQVGRAHDVNGIKSTIPKGILKCSAIGVAVSVALSILLALFAAILVYQTGDPGKYVVPAAFSVLYVAAFAGGFVTAKLNGRSAFLCGILSGTLLIVFIYLLSLIVNIRSASDYEILERILLYVAVTVCTIIGAFIGATRKNSRRKKGKNHKKR